MKNTCYALMTLSTVQDVPFEQTYCHKYYRLRFPAIIVGYTSALQASAQPYNYRVIRRKSLMA